MTQFEQLDLLLNEYGGIIQTFQVIDNGISKPVFYSYVKERGLEQAAHGVYVSPDTWTDAMYILHLRCSQAVFFGWTLTISFSVFFLLIRKYTNGYHAATYSKCLFCSILLEVVLLASISYVFRTGLALLFLTIVSDITILYIAPVNNKSIHWSTNEFKAAKIAVRWLLLILNIFAILLVGTQIAPSILQGLVAALTADAITLSISRCQN